MVSSRGIPLEQEREIKVYLPPAYDEGEERYPLLVVNNGIQALQYGKMDRSLDNLIGASVAPMIVAFVPPLQIYREYGGRFTDEYATLLVDEIVPDLENRYRTVRDRDSRAIMGAHIGALAAVYTALHHPRVFGKVALQSLNPWAKEEEVLSLARSLDRPMQLDAGVEGIGDMFLVHFVHVENELIFPTAAGFKRVRPVVEIGAVDPVHRIWEAKVVQHVPFNANPLLLAPVDEVDAVVAL